MIGLDAVSANRRMARMEGLLSDIRIEGVPQLISIGVSHAFADFADLTELEATIKRADEGMYRQKQRRKGRLATELRDPRCSLGTFMPTSPNDEGRTVTLLSGLDHF
ncbi:MAG TPA: hypothetical protein VGI80_08365 [Pyrinomonadaceae bacterium]|jgi:hypothetical protein